MSITSELAEKLGQAMKRSGNSGTIANLRRLSGGANMETWSFDWIESADSSPMILRRVPGAVENAGIGDLDIETEARLISVTAEYSVPVPSVFQILEPGDQLGGGFVMSREEGEALPNRILTDERFAVARDGLAYECGVILAKIHSVPLEKCPKAWCFMMKVSIGIECVAIWMLCPKYLQYLK